MGKFNCVKGVPADILPVTSTSGCYGGYSADLPPIAFDSQNIAAAQWLCDDSKVPQCPIAASSIPDTPGIYLPPELLKKIIKGIRKQFGLSLIGIDLIHDISTQRLAIIDVNAFPSKCLVSLRFHVPIPSHYSPL